MKTKDAYATLSRELTRYEQFGIRTVGERNRLFDISNKIVWLWKWKHITEQEMHDLCDRVTAIYENAM